jgi:hypothetical protein
MIRAFLVACVVLLAITTVAGAARGYTMLTACTATEQAESAKR